MSNISLSNALIYSGIGIAIVFAVLLVLIIVISVMSAVISKKKAPDEKIAREDTAYAPGSCGEINTFGVPDKTAAMIMAIVADKMQTPLNRLRFISIKEIKDGEENEV